MARTDPKSELAKRLAKESNLPQEQAAVFLDAFLTLLAENLYSTGPFGLLRAALEAKLAVTHDFLFPLKQKEDGTIVVSTTQPRTVPYSGSHPGPYPGPLAGPFLKVSIGQGRSALDLNKLDVGTLKDAMLHAGLKAKIKGVETARTVKTFKSPKG